MENKHEICEALMPVLRRTRALRDLEDLEYHVYPAEEVHAIFRGGYTKKINVEADSGIALIRDVVNNIGL